MSYLQSTVTEKKIVKISSVDSTIKSKTLSPCLYFSTSSWHYQYDFIYHAIVMSLIIVGGACFSQVRLGYIDRVVINARCRDKVNRMRRIQRAVNSSRFTVDNVRPVTDKLQE